MHRIGIIGHFGYGLNLSNGQTIKTITITEAVRSANREVITIDTHGGVKAILPVVLGCIKCLSSCSDIVILLTENGLKAVVPVLAILNRLYHRKLHYIVIGGWLHGFLKKERVLKRFLQRFNYIYVETGTMKKALESSGFSNVILMPNCKKLCILREEELVYSTQEPLALCTFSRVMKEKGIGTVVEAVKKINEALGRTAYKLDIYGQVDEAQQPWFEDLKSKFPPYISYRGIVPADGSVEVLKHYFALVFPTHFYTEGMPGTIIDAYAAGVPVVSAKWESFSDAVDEGRTGLGYAFDNADELKQLLRSMLENPAAFNALKPNCLNKAKAYTTEEAVKILTERLS